MRGVGDELALAVDEALEPRAHLVERAREALLLGRALDRHAGVEVALAEAGGGGVEAAQRAGDLAGDQRAGAEPEQQHEHADRDEAEDRGARGAADGLDALGDPHRALGPAGGEHRHGGGEDLLVERVGTALGLEAAAAQGGGDLRAIAVVAAELGGAVGVGDEAAARVGDDHAAAGGLGDRADDPAQLRGLA